MTAKKEGIESFLEEQAAGGGVSTLNRPNAPTQGKGNELPLAPMYEITTPYKDRQTGQPTYTGMTGLLPFINGRGLTPDRELAWRLKWDFGYEVKPIMDASKVVAVPLGPSA